MDKGGIGMEKLYTLYDEKDKSFYHFMKFFEFMIDKQRYHTSKKNEDYVYHFYKLPEYLQEHLGRVRHTTIQDLATIGVTVNTMSDRVNKLTNLSMEEK